ncbi:MAG: Flp pilus assembly complex ATPase component TadA [Planctomycetes bacterium]|nr:Flp pilus assembly complex ATPase component TadA [Planctomycetota bacterium]
MIEVDTKRIETLLQAMTRVGASALHLVPGRTPALRVQRRFVVGDEAPVRGECIDDFVRDLLFSDHREQLARTGHVAVLYVAHSGSRYRVTVAEANGQTSVVIRPMPETPPQFDQLELPPQVAGFTRCRSGLLLVGGFFGAGKSTTLAAIVEALNQDQGRHVMTVEDTIQYVHQDGPALLLQREVGTHVASAADGIREAMLIGVDVIVVGELRDLAAVEAALAAAESGCLVIGGVEAGSVVGAISEVVHLAAFEQRPRLRTRLARVLRGATAQSLLNRTHSAGRVPVVEVMVGNLAVRQAIRRGALHELPGIMQRCRGLGMQSIDVALRQLLANHLVTPEEASLHANEREEVVASPLPHHAR